MYEKGKQLFLAEFSWAEFGGIPPTPERKIIWPKNTSGIGAYPPPPSPTPPLEETIR